jgi:hypothetical protein
LEDLKKISGAEIEKEMQIYLALNIIVANKFKYLQMKSFGSNVKQVTYQRNGSYLE